VAAWNAGQFQGGRRNPARPPRCFGPVFLSRRQSETGRLRGGPLREIVEAVKNELKLPALQTRLQPIQLGTQIPLIQNGTIDIVCGPATNTLERQKVVAFSNTIFVSSIRAVVRKDGSIKTFEDLADKPVSLTTGSTSIALLATRGQEKNFQTL